MNVTEKIRENQSSHFYYPDGKPAFEVPGAKPGTMVKPSIIHARKLGLLPSVTTIFKILAKEAVNVWRIEQMFRASQNIQRLENETEDDYFTRIIEESERISNEARAFGDSLHKFIEAELGGTVHTYEVPIPEETQKAIRAFILEHVKEPKTEFQVIGDGYAGTVDCKCLFDGEEAIVDWKNQGTLGKKPTYYPEWIYQGAAYCLPENVKKFVSVLISRDEPGKIDFKIYTPEEMERGQDIFLTLKTLYRKINKL